MRSHRAWAAAATAAVLMTVAGCSALETLGAPSVHLVQVSQHSTGEPATVHVAQVHGLPKGSTDWTVAGLDPASRTIAMEWTDSPSPECGEVNRIEVAERADAVTIGLSDTANDPSLVCALVGVSRRFELHLQQPLAGRALLEPVTGVNDGLPHFRTGMPPLPTCSTDANPANVPVGMPDAAAQIAPRNATHATICRTAWPHGSARTTEAQVSDPAKVRQLVNLLNGAGHPRPMGEQETRCETRSPGSWFAVYLTGPNTRVEVFVDEINCATVTNGSLQGKVTPAIGRTLGSYFHS